MSWHLSRFYKQCYSKRTITVNPHQRCPEWRFGHTMELHCSSMVTPWSACSSHIQFKRNWGRCRGIVVWPLDSHIESPGSIPAVALYFCPSARHLIQYPHCCSPPRFINGDPGGCEQYCAWLSWPSEQACKMLWRALHPTILYFG